MIWDEGKTTTSPINLLNAIWKITINEISRSKVSTNILDIKNIARKIKGENSTIIKAFPKKLIASEIGKLNLRRFLA